VTRRIDFTPRARAQFLVAVGYVHAEGPSAARGFRNRSMDALEHAIRFPESNRTIPEFTELGFREVLVGRYRFC